MIVRSFELAAFRNYETAKIDLTNGVTIFVGPNGQGKTNLLEAVEYAATGRSHRVSADGPLVKAGEQSAVVRTKFESAGRELLVEIQIEASGTNTIRINKQPARRKDLAGQFPIVLFAPNDLALVRGEPTERRTFLNEQIVMIHQRAIEDLTSYDRILKQRNTLLKSAKQFRLSEEKLDTLDTWSHQLAEFGSRILLARVAFIKELEPWVSGAYQAISGSTNPVSLELESTVAVTDGDTEEQVAARFLEVLAELRLNEIDRGVTLVGPHRDDLIIRLDGLESRTHASHGEGWSLALALRLGVAELIRVVSRVGDPVVMLDDVFAELDAGRRERLAGLLSGFDQILISAAIAEDLPELVQGRRIRISNGEVLTDG